MTLYGRHFRRILLINELYMGARQFFVQNSVVIVMYSRTTIFSSTNAT